MHGLRRVGEPRILSGLRSGCYDFRVSGPNSAGCPDRADLAKELEEATALVHSAKQEYDQVRKAKSTQGDLIRLVEALTKARWRARVCQHAYNAHVAAHHCGE